MSVQAALTGTPSVTPAASASAQQIKWVNEILPYALAEQKRTGIPAEVFIVQSGVETGWGTSGWWLQNHNPAGIGVTGAPGAGYTYASTQQAFDAYGDKLLGHGEAGQGQFVKDVNAHASVQTLLTDLERSPWAAGHYGGTGLNTAATQVFGINNPAAGGVPSDFAPSNDPGQTASLTGSVAGGVANALTGGVSGIIGGALGIGVKAVPGLKGIVDAGKTAVALETMLIGVFTNWRYVLEVVIGGWMVIFGLLLIAHDIGATKGAGKAVESAGAVAAVAA